MTKLIPLTKGQHAIVDDEDYDFLMQWKWYRAGRYATRHDNDTRRLVYMHWAIIGKPPKGGLTDHINGNSLDNQKTNLRTCTHAENMRNRRSDQGSRSHYKGVCWHNQNNKWVVRIAVNRKQIYLGCFISELDAAKAYDAAARAHHGEFARLNFPESE